MSLGEAINAIAGWNRVHGPAEKLEPPTEEEFAEMLENAVI